MSLRKIQLEDEGFYHICNHAIDQKDLFLDRDDLDRFLLLLDEFNEIKPSGGIYQIKYLNQNNYRRRVSKLVNIICYCLNPNHFHLMLQQVAENGVEKFIHRATSGYAKFYNNKYLRSGPLFRGAFKAYPINDDAGMQETSAYINLNNQVHKLPKNAITASSWGEFTGKKEKKLCSPDIILDQFKDDKKYEKFALDMLPIFWQAKKEQGELEKLGLT